MKTPEAEARRALTRLRRALEKARREIRGLRELLDQSEADGYPGDDYAEMDDHLAAVVDMVHREQARQQAKVLRAGGIGTGLLDGSATLQRSDRLSRSGSLTRSDTLKRSGLRRRSSPASASVPPGVPDPSADAVGGTPGSESPGEEP